VRNPRNPRIWPLVLALALLLLIYPPLIAYFALTVTDYQLVP
jgi:hypothetical protein